MNEQEAFDRLMQQRPEAFKEMDMNLKAIDRTLKKWVLKKPIKSFWGDKNE